MKVVDLRSGKPPLSDVAGRLRLLADQIESGEVTNADTAYVILPQAGAFPRFYGFGDVDGRNNDPIIQCELAKLFLLNNRLST